MAHVIIWDLETTPDLPAVARVNGFAEDDETAARSALGGKFAKLPHHAIACIGALVAERTDNGFRVRSLGAPHTGDRSEAELIRGFVDRIAELLPQMVGFNTCSFDLPVLRFRAMVHGVSAPGLAARPYFHRYTDACLDLCDVLASHDARGKVNLNDLCRTLQFAGKPQDIDGSEVDRYVQEGRIQDVANYCETDVVSTYRVWLRYELFRGGLGRDESEASEENLFGYIRQRLPVKPHLGYLLGQESAAAAPVLPFTFPEINREFRPESVG
jgi:3'-5' exonuclease